MTNPLQIDWEDIEWAPPDNGTMCPGCIYCEPEGWAHPLKTVLPWWQNHNPGEESDG